MKPERRRELILSAAAQVFAKKGYHAASISDIIEAAGIARGTFYLYFDSKREIFEELIDILALRIRGCLRRLDLSPGQPPWVEQLRSNISRLTMTILDEPELAQILYSHTSGLDEEFDQKLKKFYADLTKATEGAFRLGQEMGLIRPEINPYLAALHLVGSAKEVLYNMAVNPELNVKVDELVHEVMSYTIEGMFVRDLKLPQKK